MTRDDPSAGSPGAACAAAAEPAGARESTLQTFRKEVCFTDRPCSNLLPKLGRSQEHICCKCRARFRGHLPVPKAEAALPYWVPLSLRPQKQAPKMVQPRVSTPAKACLCPCHRFGGLLPVPRDQAVMPYWVPRGLRSQKKAPPGLTLPAQPPADLRWGQLLKGQLLALPQDELRAPGRAAPQPQHCEPPPKCRHGRSVSRGQWAPWVAWAYRSLPRHFDPEETGIAVSTHPCPWPWSLGTALPFPLIYTLSRTAWQAHDLELVAAHAQCSATGADILWASRAVSSGPVRLALCCPETEAELWALPFSSAWQGLHPSAAEGVDGQLSDVPGSPLDFFPAWASRP